MITLFFVMITASATIAKPQVVIDKPVKINDNEDTTDSKSGDNEHSDETSTSNGDKGDSEDSDHNGVADKTETEAERQVQVEQNSNQWKVESELKNGNQKDHIQAEFQIGDGKPEVKFEYKSEANSTETEMKYRVNFNQLVEFNNDAVAGYQKGNDTVVSKYDLSKVDWNPIAYTTEDNNGVTTHIASATTADGVFTLILRISTGFTNINNTIVTPNAIKIDIVINGFDYQGNDTYLSLQTDIKTQSETSVSQHSDDEKNGFATNEEQVSVGSGSTNGFFSWVKTAKADGVMVNIIPSNLTKVSSGEEDGDLESGEQQKIMYFTFDAVTPQRIDWDPKVGVDNLAFIAAINATDVSGANFLVFSLWALFVGLAVPILHKKRKQNN